MPRTGLTPDRVVATAAALVDAEGVDALTLARLAADLGVRTPSLYNHVDGLDDLRRRLARRALEELGRRLARAAVGHAGRDAVRALATAYRAFAADHPGLYVLTLAPGRLADEAVERASAEIVATVVDALAASRYDGDEAIHATRSLRSALHGFVSLELGGGFDPRVDLDATFAWLVELLAAGLVPSAPADATEAPRPRRPA